MYSQKKKPLHISILGKCKQFHNFTVSHQYTAFYIKILTFNKKDTSTFLYYSFHILCYTQLKKECCKVNNFTFYNPTKILFGEGNIENLADHIPKNKKVLIIYGGGSVQRFGTLDKVKSALADYQVGEFSGIEPNPTFETAMKAVEKVKEENYDFLLAVGGGSVIDGTKFIAAAAKFDGDPTDIFGKGIGAGETVTDALPLGTVLTLPATGSEMNGTSVITFKDKKAKVSFKTPMVNPVFSILDPTLTYTLPKRQLANGISDAFSHVFEQYMTYPVGAKIPDRFSEGVMRTLIEIAPDVVNEDKHDYNTRANYMWAATVALNGWLGTGVPQDWATHSLGHEITALNNTDHARSLTAVLPSLMLIRKEEKREKLIQYGKEVWGLTGLDDDAIINEAINKTKDFFKSIDMPVSLKQIGIERRDIDQLVSQLETHENINISERKDQTAEISRKIYEEALEEQTI